MSETSAPRRSILTGISGNVLEWYDFALYGYFAPVIASQFFPAQDKLASLIATFGVFAAGYLTRPLGGLFLGRLADRAGRQKALRISVLMMATPTFLMGLLPTYSQVGVWSSVILTLFRLIQGFSVGGEFVASITFLTDHAPPGKRCYYSSWATFGALFGMLLGSAAGALVTSALDSASVASWGWRVPFLFGIVLGGAALSLRRSGGPPGEQLPSPPLRSVLASQAPTLARMVLAVWVFGVGFYMLFLYLSTYISTETAVPQAEALRLNTVCMVVLIALIPLAGRLADRYSSKSVIIGGVVGLMLTAYPLFWLIDRGQAHLDLLCQLVFAVLMALMQGAYPEFLVSIFPAATRTTSVAISYNISLALFGGTTPMVATALIDRFQDKLAPSIYLTVAAVISLLALLTVKPLVIAPEDS